MSWIKTKSIHTKKEKCDAHFHADVNAARNIIHVQDKMSSVVPGRQT